MAPDEIRHIAAEAARAAVNELLVNFGVNVQDPNGIITLQKDFAMLRSWRESVETVKQQGLKTAVIFIVTGIMGALWVVFKGH